MVMMVMVMVMVMMMMMMMMMMMSTTMPMVLMHKMAHGILISRCGGRRTDKRHSHPVTAKPKVADPKPNLAHSIQTLMPRPKPQTLRNP